MAVHKTVSLHLPKQYYDMNCLLCNTRTTEHHPIQNIFKARKSSCVSAKGPYHSELNPGLVLWGGGEGGGWGGKYPKSCLRGRVKFAQVLSGGTERRYPLVLSGVLPPLNRTRGASPCGQTEIYENITFPHTSECSR